jgi:hypothetical protein
MNAVIIAPSPSIKKIFFVFIKNISLLNSVFVFHFSCITSFISFNYNPY